MFRHLAAAGVSALALTAAVPAAAAPLAASNAGFATVRAAHFSPDTPGVDVYVTSFSGKQTLFQSNVGYGDVSAYRRVPAGVYAVSMRPHGAAPSTPPGLRWTLDARAGQAYTAAAVGTNAKLTGIVLDDSLKPPAKGHGLVRVIQAASRAPSAKLVAGSVVLAAAARFPSATSYTEVPAGRWTVVARSGAVQTSAPVTIKAGAVDTVLVLDAKGPGITLRTLNDAAAPGTTPNGSLDTGGGGTARQPGSANGSEWLAASAAALALAALVLLLRRRTRLG